MSAGETARAGLRQAHLCHPGVLTQLQERGWDWWDMALSQKHQSQVGGFLSLPYA